MNALLEPDKAVASTTSISTNLEDLWRNQFFAGQGQTPAEILPELRAPERATNFRRMTATVKFPGAGYDPAIIRFYEDIILELQKQVVRYKNLWESAAKAHREVEESYVARDTIRPSESIVKKLRTATKPGLRISAE